MSASARATAACHARPTADRAPSASPTPPPRAAARPRAGRTALFERTTHVLRAVRAADCWSRSCSRSRSRPVPAFEKFGFGFFVTNVWNPVTSELRRAGADLRHAGHVGDRAADRRAGQLRHRAVPHRDVPGRRSSGRSGTAVELLAAIPSIIYGMWGLFVFAPFFGDYIQPLLTQASSATSGSSVRCSRARPTASACCRPASSCRSW